MERTRATSPSKPTVSVSNSHPPVTAAADGDNTITVTIQQNAQEGDTRPRRSSASSQKKSFSLKELPSQKKWTFLVMAFANFAACTCFSLLAPFFPKEAERKGVSQTVIGLMFSSFELWIFLSAPVFGNYLTRIGSKFMFTSGLFICGGCAVLFGVLDKCPPDATFITMCFLVRSLEALGASAFITSSFAIIANEFPDHVSSVFGALETFSGLGLMVGPPIGGALYEVGGFGLPFWMMGSLLIACSIVTALLLATGPDNPKPDRGSIVRLLTSPLVIVTLVTIIGGSYSLGFLDPTLSGHLEQFHLRTVYVGLVFIVAPAVYAFTAPLWGNLSDKGMSSSLTIVGNIVACLSFLLLGPSPLLPFVDHQLWLVIVSLLVMGLSVGCTLVCTIKCLLNGAKSVGFEDNLDTFGLVSGLFNSGFSFGTFLGPTVGSIIQDHYGFDWASTVTAFIFAFAAILFSSYLCLSKGCQACCRRLEQRPSSEQLFNQGSASSVAYGSLSQTAVISSVTNVPSDNI